MEQNVEQRSWERKLVTVSYAVFASPKGESEREEKSCENFQKKTRGEGEGGKLAVLLV